jgi:hypothetical protein
VRSGEFAAALSCVFAMASVLNGWLIVWPVMGLILAYFGRRRAVNGPDSDEARLLSVFSAWLCGLALVGWISYLMVLSK